MCERKKPPILRTSGHGEVLWKSRAGFGKQKQDYD